MVVNQESTRIAPSDISLQMTWISTDVSIVTLAIAALSYCPWLLWNKAKK